MRYFAITLPFMACAGTDKNTTPTISGEMVFEQDSSEGVCHATWSFEGVQQTNDCQSCEYETIWIFQATYAAVDQFIPNDCQGSRIADYGAAPEAQTEALNAYYHLIGYTTAIPDQENGVIMFGHHTDDGETLAPLAAMDWLSDSEFTWSRMGPNQVITERGQAIISD